MSEASDDAWDRAEARRDDARNERDQLRYESGEAWPAVQAFLLACRSYDRRCDALIPVCDQVSGEIYGNAAEVVQALLADGWRPPSLVRGRS